MDTSETEEKEKETDKTDQGDQPMTEAILETEAPLEKEGMEVTESEAAQETTEKGTPVTSVTSERPKDKTAEKQSKKPKTKRKATPLYADVGDRATLLRAVNTLTIRQKKSNECIDIENVRASTFRFNKMGDYLKKGQKAAAPVTKAMGDEEAYQVELNMYLDKS